MTNIRWMENNGANRSVPYAEWPNADSTFRRAFVQLIQQNGMDFHHCEIAVLGQNKAVQEGIVQLGGTPVTLGKLYQAVQRFSYLVNTTAIGSFPDTDQVPVDLSLFRHLKGVIDLVADPLRTKLCFEAKCLGIPYLSGYKLQIRQAALAEEQRTGIPVREDQIQVRIHKLLCRKSNIVLIGMPTSGKTSTAARLHEITGIPAWDMDEVLTQELGTPIRQCFEEKGEEYFRDRETDMAKRLAQKEGIIISCGGGVIKRKENMRMLSEHGLIVLLHRKALVPSDDRPLSNNEESLKRLYQERKPLYEMYSDVVVDNDGTLEQTAAEILRKAAFTA